ncbi:MAG: hypothetical protein RLZZ290_457 [Pseudomonadota bacterium]
MYGLYAQIRGSKPSAHSTSQEATPARKATGPTGQYSCLATHGGGRTALVDFCDSGGGVSTDAIDV